MRSWRRLGQLVALVTILTLALLGCGEEADSGDGVTATPPATDPATPTPDAAAGPTPSPAATPSPTPTEDGTEVGMDGDTAEIVAVDYEFEGVPATVDTPTALTLRNDSDAELHELVLLRLPDAEERSAEELLQLTPEEQEELLAGSVVGVSVAMPGEEGMVVEGDLGVEEPGRYLMVCFVPTGADPEEFMAAAAESEGGPPEVEGGPPHVVHGMWAEFTADG